jgi:CRISPR-associated protein Cmr5
MIEREGQTRRQNIEQQRGRQAWDDILQIKALGDKEQKEYRSLARSLNAMIQINGLGQTLGFLKAKGKNTRGQRNAHSYLLGHLTHWMHGHFDRAISDATESENDGLLRWLTNTASSADYRRATTECLAFGVWLRRFAEGELKEPDAGDE